MPYLEKSADCRIYYEIDDWTDPWTDPETVLFIHGFTETIDAWRFWVPHLSRNYRLIRVDLRGFGKTGPVPKEFKLTTELFVDDLVYVINHLARGPVHVISGKSGGISAVKLGAMRPDLVSTITFAGPPVVPPPKTENWISTMEGPGMREWARGTMVARLGTKMPLRGIDWWVDMMGQTALSTAHAYLRWVGALTPADLRVDLDRIKCPTLVIGTDTPGRTKTEFELYQKKLPNAEMVSVAVDGYHASGGDPDSCAKLTLEFLRRYPGGRKK